MRLLPLLPPLHFNPLVSGITIFPGSSTFPVTCCFPHSSPSILFSTWNQGTQGWSYYFLFKYISGLFKDQVMLLKIANKDPLQASVSCHLCTRLHISTGHRRWHSGFPQDCMHLHSSLYCSGFLSLNNQVCPWSSPGEGRPFLLLSNAFCMPAVQTWNILSLFI